MRDSKSEDWEDEWIAGSFDLAALTDREVRHLFRFQREDLLRLRTALRIPDQVITAQRDRVSGNEAFCILLRRLAYPCRWLELRRLFGRTTGTLSRIFYHILRHISAKFSHLMRTLNQDWLTEEDFQLFAAAVAGKGGTVPGCFGFIDGTAHRICRPRHFQRSMYSGHKRIHCLKWQCVVVPNGKLVNNL